MRNLHPTPSDAAVHDTRAFPVSGELNTRLNPDGATGLKVSARNTTVAVAASLTEDTDKRLCNLALYV